MLVSQRLNWLAVVWWFLLASAGGLVPAAASETLPVAILHSITHFAQPIYHGHHFVLAVPPPPTS